MNPEIIKFACPVGSLVVGLVAGFALGRLSAGKRGAKCRQNDKAVRRDAGKKEQFRKQQREERQFAKTHPAPADGSVEIYVGNLSYTMAENELNDLFAAYGKVASARIITNRFNNKSKGFGFVIMPDRAEAEKAIAALEGKEVMGRPIKVNEARNLDKTGIAE